ncbi:MAG: hypothetical protein ACQKBW_06690, partial [Puniceicoccales bacterium]
MTRQKQKALSWVVLSALLIGCIAFTFFLIPTDEEIVARYISDGEYERAREELSAMAAIASTPEQHAAIQAQRDRLTVAEALFDGSPVSEKVSARLLNLIFDKDLPNDSRDWMLQGLALSESLPAPTEAQKDAAQTLDYRTRANIRDGLVRAALAAEQPYQAALWYEALLDSEPTKAD